MRYTLALSLAVSLWIINRRTPIKLVIRFLFVSILLTLFLTRIRLWKGYFLSLLYVGGLLIIIIYFARLTKWKEIPPFLFLPLIAGPLLISERLQRKRDRRITTLFINNNLDFLLSILLILFRCFLIRQILFIEKTLRSFYP